MKLKILDRLSHLFSTTPLDFYPDYCSATETYDDFCLPKIIEALNIGSENTHSTTHLENWFDCLMSKFKSMPLFSSTVENLRAWHRETYYLGKQRKDDDVVLTHGTYSNHLPNIIRLKGLYPTNEAEKYGITKVFGGENGGQSSDNPSSVSFWHNQNDNAFMIKGGYGSKKGLEYPICFGISKKDNDKIAKRLKLAMSDGQMKDEKTLPYVPFEYITKVFVPSFAVEHVKELFRQHNITHAEVLSLGSDS